MITILNKEQCCGCKACVQACPKQCIRFNLDDTGFGYPEVNIQECINCGLCERVCPILSVQDYELPNDTLTYAAYHREELERLESSSGGIFSALAEYVINKKGVVYGAAFDDHFNVTHCYADTISDLEKLKRSKYVQSNIGHSYEEIKLFLQEGRLVLFSGVPCQVAGLRSFLRKDYSNLILLDVVCHGVASPAIWQKYLEEIKDKIALDNGIERKEHVVIKNISFRDKRNSWRKYNISIYYEILPHGPIKEKKEGEFSKCIWEDDYMLCFLKNYSLRPSCYKCSFRNGKSRSDITLADFWGIENCVQDYNYSCEKGTSLVMLHNLQMDNIIEELPVEKIKVDFKKAIKANSPVIRDVVAPLSRSMFFRHIKTGSLHFAFINAEKFHNKFWKYVHFYKRVVNRIRLIIGRK